MSCERQNIRDLSKSALIKDLTHHKENYRHLLSKDNPSVLDSISMIVHNAQIGMIQSELVSLHRQNKRRGRAKQE